MSTAFLPFKFMRAILFVLCICCLALAVVVATAHHAIKRKCIDNGFPYRTGHRPCEDVCPPMRTTDISLYFCKTNCPGTLYF